MSSGLIPRNEHAIFNKGVALEHLGKETEAIHAFTRVLDIDSREKDALLAKGMGFGNTSVN